jgi:hypothetical protein
MPPNLVYHCEFTKTTNTKKGGTMTNHSTLSTNLMKFVLDSGLKFHDIRTAATFGWALVGLLISETIHLNHWALFRPGPTKMASKERQFSRWLHNDKIRPMLLYPRLVQHALQSWEGKELFLALDTTLVAYRFVIVRLALVYRGRAIPLGWVVCASRSAMVPLAWYQRMLAQVAASLPTDSRVVLLADRGFADVKLMRIARQLGWHFRIRVKSNVWVHRATRGKQKIKALMPPPGGARFYSHVWLTDQQFGPLHLALAYVRTQNGYEKWAIISDEPVSLATFDEYGLRFDIEENFLDDKSNGFQLEASQLEDAESVSRLCFLLATASLYLLSTGTAVVEMGKRHLVDPHWFRGLSYLQLGWRWVKRAFHIGEKLLDFPWLSPEPDPEPAMASKKQFYQPDLWLSSVEAL